MLGNLRSAGGGYGGQEMIDQLYNYPQIRADDTSSDFLNVTYINRAVTGENQARVVNELHGQNAETLLKMVDGQQLVWMIEIRSPATLYSKTFKSFQSETDIRWDIATTGEKMPVFIISQMVALEDVLLPAGLLHPVWRNRPAIRVPAGAVLAQGNVLTAEPLLASILQFVRDDSLPDGVIKVSEPDEHLRFTVATAADLHRQIAIRRDVHLGALIAAMGKLNADDHDPDESRVLRSISQRLAENNVEDWTQDGYEPALAATCLEQFLTELAEPE